ncbi:MAG: hypothetical protein IJX62_08075 [Clostridia bacterium]|nr:hypothetical protein [Clostridia bacterium]
MKQLLKVAAALLCLTAVLLCTSCAQDSATDDATPEGMKIATCAGEDFRLYVPTVWNENTDYGVSGAYYNLSTQSTVSAKKYPITGDMRTQMEANAGKGNIQWFWEAYCRAAVEAYSFDGTVEQREEPTDTVLGGLNAKRYCYRARINGAVTDFLQVVGQASDAFYVVSFAMDETLYAPLSEDMQKILTAFRIGDTPYEPEGYQKVLDENAQAPQGMKLASNKDVAYFFYVPTDWVVEQQETVFAAYVAGDRSSVSVVPYMPSQESMSVAEYFEMTSKRLTDLAGADSMTMISDASNPQKVDLGGRQASVYVYTYKIGDTVYYYQQWIAAYKSMIYAVTYTAPTQQAFDSHMADVERIVAEFEFR